MSAYDFQVYSTGEENASRISYRTNITAATFVTGEPVVDDGAGEALLCGDDPANVLGIALEPAVSSGSRMAAMEVTDTGDVGRLIDIPTPQKRYVARYFSTDGAAAAVPTVGNAIGNLAGFTLNIPNAGNWCLDTAATNLHVRIEDVLDTDGLSLLHDTPTTGPGVRVVFRFL